ncbi:TetR/AcrR family transcriptional regulator [Candidatus Phycosocius bacilliformis]|nr:TetR/AcrR family transcriptional regulator [Candidatus Phycosocius bacilliformis]
MSDMTDRKQGAQRLIAAARLEFNEKGFEGTHTNAIARRAGFAPQTFYRHFADKLAIFLAVYRLWAEEENEALSSATSPDQMVDVLLRHHASHRLFRRALRYLTNREAEVARVRAHSRQSQMAAAMARFPALDPTKALLLILTLERLSDGLIEGEIEACGISAAATRAAMVDLLEKARLG